MSNHLSNKLVILSSAADRNIVSDERELNVLLDTELASFIDKFKTSDFFKINRPSRKNFIVRGDNEYKSYRFKIISFLILSFFPEFVLKILLSKNKYLLVGIGINAFLNRYQRKSGSKSVEIIHGFCYTSVPWGWDMMRYRDLPTDIIVFDQISLATFATLRQKFVRVHLAQHPRYEIPIDECTLLPHDQHILIALQYGYDGEDRELQGILKNGIIPQIVLELIAELPNYKSHLV